MIIVMNSKRYRPVSLEWGGVAEMMQWSACLFDSREEAVTPLLFFRIPIDMDQANYVYGCSHFLVYLDGCSIMVNHADMCVPNWQLLVWIWHLVYPVQ